MQRNVKKRTSDRARVWPDYKSWTPTRTRRCFSAAFRESGEASDTRAERRRRQDIARRPGAEGSGYYSARGVRPADFTCEKHATTPWHFALICGSVDLVTRNTLPLHVTSASSLTVFKQHLKLHLFCFSFPGLSPQYDFSVVLAVSFAT